MAIYLQSFGDFKAITLYSIKLNPLQQCYVPRKLAGNILSATNVISTTNVRPVAILELFMVKRTHYEAPHYEISPTLLLLFFLALTSKYFTQHPFVELRERVK
jgi:hypothetical protein